jgi:hypothetical protein
MIPIEREPDPPMAQVFLPLRPRELFAWNIVGLGVKVEENLLHDQWIEAMRELYPETAVAITVEVTQEYDDEGGYYPVLDVFSAWDAAGNSLGYDLENALWSRLLRDETQANPGVNLLSEENEQLLDELAESHVNELSLPNETTRFTLGSPPYSDAIGRVFFIPDGVEIPENVFGFLTGGVTS